MIDEQDVVYLEEGPQASCTRIAAGTTALLLALGTFATLMRGAGMQADLLGHVAQRCREELETCILLNAWLNLQC